MKVAVLFSGGKDSTYAAYLSHTHGHTLTCLITLESANPESYMFHTPSIAQVSHQAQAMNLPLLVQQTKGKKEDELIDLHHAIAHAKEHYNITGVVTGTVESAYQASRIQRICDSLDLDCFNPLWQQDQLTLLQDLISSKFDIIITGVFAYPLDQSWLGRTIDARFLSDVQSLHQQYAINPAGEGGEFETYVLNCPLFKRPLTITNKTITGKHHSWTMEIEVT